MSDLDLLNFIARSITLTSICSERRLPKKYVSVSLFYLTPLLYLEDYVVKRNSDFDHKLPQQLSCSLTMDEQLYLFEFLKNNQIGEILDYYYYISGSAIIFIYDLRSAEQPKV